MTATQLITKCWTRLNIPASNDFWSQSNLLAWINEGYKDFVEQTLCLRKFVLIDITASTTEYDLPNDCLQVLWTGYSNESLVPTSVNQLDILDQNWIGREGTPFVFVIELDGFSKLRLYETPAISSTALGNSTTALIDFEDWNDNLLLLYVYEPSDLIVSESPDLEISFQWGLIYYTLWKAFEKMGDSQDIEQADFYRIRYYEKVAEKKSLFNKPCLTKIANWKATSESGEEEGPFIHKGDEVEYNLGNINELNIANGGYLAFGDADSNGTWKIIVSGNDKIIQRRESGSYEEKMRFEA